MPAAAAESAGSQRSMAVSKRIFQDCCRVRPSTERGAERAPHARVLQAACEVWRRPAGHIVARALCEGKKCHGLRQALRAVGREHSAPQGQAGVACAAGSMSGAETWNHPVTPSARPAIQTEPTTLPRFCIEGDQWVPQECGTKWQRKRISCKSSGGEGGSPGAALQATMQAVQAATSASTRWQDLSMATSGLPKQQPASSPLRFQINGNALNRETATLCTGVAAGKLGAARLPHNI